MESNDHLNEFNKRKIYSSPFFSILIPMTLKYIAIAAMARNRVIGNEGKIPWHLPEDFRHFKSTTEGHPIIMGRKTFESIGRILPGRENIVLTRGEFTFPGLTVIHSLDELDRYLSEKEYPIAFVCG